MRIVDSAGQDLRHAIRSLRRSPGFAFAAIVVLALGIGATTAVFSVVSNVLLRPLPYQHEDRLIVLWQEYKNRGWGIVGVSQPNLASVARQTRTLDGVAGLGFTEIAVRDKGPAFVVPGVYVTPDAFRLIGASAATGRTLLPSDADPGAENVVVLSDSLWKRRFGGASDVIGRAVSLDGVIATIAGVMPRDFALPPRFRATVGGTPVTAPRVDIWIPLRLDTDPETVGHRNLIAFGRLAPGVSIGSARKEFAAIPERLLKEFPGPANTGLSFQLVPLRDQVVGDVRRPLVLLLGAVTLVVLIACANVAGMLLARTRRRHAEFALRAAVGASRGRLVRQTIIESLLLAGIAGAIGTLLAFLGTIALSTSIAARLPQVSEIGVSASLLTFAVVLSTAVGLTFGIAPAIQASASAPYSGTPRLRDTGSMSLWPSTRRVLLTAEAALAVVLLIGAGLFLRNFLGLVAVHPGFEPAGTAAVGVRLPAEYATPDSRDAVVGRLLDRLRALPGVREAGLTNQVPFAGGAGTAGLRIAGRPEAGPEDRPHVATRMVDDAFFRALGVRVLSGRTLDRDDRDGRVALISLSAARRYWRDQNPIGQRIRPDGLAEWLTIVGVVEDVLHAGLHTAPEPTVYWPYGLSPTTNVGIVIKGDRPGGALLTDATREIGNAFPSIPLTMASSFDDLVSESVAESRLYMSSLVAFAIVALVLAASGLYGVLSHLVGQRRRDIGVRIALGASYRAVLFMVLREGIVPVLTGVAIGLVAVIGGANAVRDQLYTVSSIDPLTLMVAPALLLATAVLACYIPGRRAARTDPAMTLRAD